MSWCRLSEPTLNEITGFHASVFWTIQKHPRSFRSHFSYSAYLVHFNRLKNTDIWELLLACDCWFLPCGMLYRCSLPQMPFNLTGNTTSTSGLSTLPLWILVCMYSMHEYSDAEGWLFAQYCVCPSPEIQSSCPRHWSLG